MKNENFAVAITALLLSIFCGENVAAQGYVKINALSATVGVVNPSVEFAISPKFPDPFNGSAEWYPNKIGVSIGYRIFMPK